MILVRSETALVFATKFIRQCCRTRNGQRHACWALVESYRTATEARQRVVAWLGKLDEAGRLGVQQAVDATRKAHESPSDAKHVQPPGCQLRFEFDDDAANIQPRWAEVNANGIRVENVRQFGGPWLALQLIRILQLDSFLEKVIPQGRELVPWDVTSLILVIARLLEPSSELFIAEQWYAKTAMPDLLGVPDQRIDDNRLGKLFHLEYDLLLYDVTSTCFEGAANFPLAQRGYSRDQRSDCKQVCIGMVVSRCGMPLGYEVFPGNTADVTTVEDSVEKMEHRDGKSDRIWVMDRGMVSEANIEFLREGGRRYIPGTPKSMLKKFEKEILKEDWRTIRDGLK
jgi:hypothetical protein